MDENKTITGPESMMGEDPNAMQIKLLQQIKKELKDQTAILQQILSKP